MDAQTTLTLDISEIQGVVKKYIQDIYPSLGIVENVRFDVKNELTGYGTGERYEPALNTVTVTFRKPVARAFNPDAPELAENKRGMLNPYPNVQADSVIRNDR